MSTQPSEPPEQHSDDASEQQTGQAFQQSGAMPDENRGTPSDADSVSDTPAHDQSEPDDDEPDDGKADDEKPDDGDAAKTSTAAPRAVPEQPKRPITVKSIFKLSLYVAIISGILEFIFARQFTIGAIAFAIAFVALMLGFGAMMLVERRIDRLGEDDESFPRL